MNGNLGCTFELRSQVLGCWCGVAVPVLLGGVLPIERHQRVVLVSELRRL